MAGIIPYLTRRNRDSYSLIRHDLNRLFEDIGFGRELIPSDQSNFIRPHIDVSENETEVVVNVEVPGLKEEDMSVEFSNHILIIKGEKKIDRKQEGHNYHLTERQSGSFSRSIQLPLEIEQDQIEAKFTNGVLSIRLPKSKQAQESTRKIPISKE